MTGYDMRYKLEHEMLPKWFFKDKKQLIVTLLDDHHVLHRVIGDLFKLMKMENPYQPEEFDIVPERLTDDILMVKVIYPEPEQAPLCYCSYLLFDGEFENMGFYTLEKSLPIAGNEDPYVCGWSEDETHSNYGPHKFEEGEDVFFVLKLFLKEKYGIDLEEEEE